MGGHFRPFTDVLRRIWRFVTRKVWNPLKQPAYAGGYGTATTNDPPPWDSYGGRAADVTDGGTFSANQERHPLITLIDTHTSQRNVRKSGRSSFHAAVRYVGLRSEMHSVFHRDSAATGPRYHSRRVDSARYRAPVKETIQQDGRIRRWAPIAEMDGKFLRVILLPDGETVHNAFFDRATRP